MDIMGSLIESDAEVNEEGFVGLFQGVIKLTASPQEAIYQTFFYAPHISHQISRFFWRAFQRKTKLEQFEIKMLDSTTFEPR